MTINFYTYTLNIFFSLVAINFTVLIILFDCIKSVVSTVEDSELSLSNSCDLLIKTNAIEALMKCRVPKQPLEIVERNVRNVVIYPVVNLNPPCNTQFNNNDMCSLSS